MKSICRKPFNLILQCFIVFITQNSISLTFATDINTPPLYGSGYEVYLDAEIYTFESSWTSKKAIEHLLSLRIQFPESFIEGYYDGEVVEISGNGYELYWNGRRVGHESEWNSSNAVSNFRWNTERYPYREVVSLHNTKLLGYLESVTVLPVFFIPQDQSDPTESEKDLLRNHLKTAQTRFREMLSNRDSFSISERSLEYHSDNRLEYYRNEDDGGALKYIQELLPKLNVNRFSCPYILFVVLMNPDERYPIGGGRPINGNVNFGGGLVILSSYALNNISNFQSTVQHELGHSFGLVHVSNYGYSMQTNDSIMSYNPEHHWDGFVPPSTQGILIPEDIRVLAKNNLAFPHLTFDPNSDVPTDYNICDSIFYIPAMDITPTETTGEE